MTVAAIYCRISQDRPRKRKGAPSGLADDSRVTIGKGVDSQERACRAYIAEHGWTAGEVYVDNDRSAWSRKPRPAFERLLADVAAGKVKRVVVWATDRLYRRVGDLVRITEILKDRCLISSVVESDIDLSTADGIMIANIRGAIAQAESDRKSERVKLDVERRVREGGYHGGIRPFGFTDNGLEVVPDEAAAVQRAVKDLLDGRRTLYSIAKDMPPRNGKPWTPSHVRSMLLAPRLAGHVTKGLDKAQTTARKEGRSVGLAILDSIAGPGQWPAIVDDDDWRRLVMLLTDPQRRSNIGRGSQPVHLLSGLAVCEVCRAPMRMSTATRNGKPRSYYRCPVGGHARRPAAELEEFVVSYTLRYLDPQTKDGIVPPKVADPAAPEDPGAEVARLERKLAEIDDDRDNDLIDRERWLKLNTSTKAKLEAARYRLISVTYVKEAPAVTKLRRHSEPSVAWRSMDTATKRSVLLDLWTLTVAPFPQVGTDEGRVAYWQAKESPEWGLTLSERSLSVSSESRV